MDKRGKNIILVIILGIIILGIIALIFGLVFSNDKEVNLDLTKVSSNHTIDDDMIEFLYNRYQVEDGLKFLIAGSDINDSYAFYYRGMFKFSDFSDIYKSYILLDLINYDNGSYDSKRGCYLYSLEEFKDSYKKYYGSLDDFKINTDERYSPSIYLDSDNICISNVEEGKSYSKAVDTYFVNGIYKDNEIIIYERVAFLGVSDKRVNFYSDYEMKNKVYSLDKEDISFINNSKVVSNVLLEYKEKFPIYEYHYVKGDSTYYLDSIVR